MNSASSRPSDEVPPTEPSCPAQRLEWAFARWQGELVGTLYYLVGNLDDARDALQEAFIKAWRQREQVPQVHNLKAWLFRIALNTGRDLRQSWWKRKKQGLVDDGAALTDPQRAPPAELIAREELTHLRQAIEQLRAEEQEVFLLRQNGEMTYEEIAELLEIPAGTVKTRMRLALTKLRAALATV